MSEVDELISLLKTNDSTAGAKFEELNKNELTKHWERIVLEGLIPCCQTGFGNNVFNTIQTAAKKINDVVPPRVLMKNLSVLEKLIDASLIDFTPAANISAYMKADTVIGINATYMMQVVTKVMKEPEAAKVILPKLIKKVKSSKDSTLRSTFISPLSQIATTAPEAIAPFNDFLIDLISNKDQIWTIAAMALNQSAKFNLDPCIEAFDTFVDLVDENAMNLVYIGQVLDALADKRPDLFDGDMLKMLNNNEDNATYGYFVWQVYGKLAKDAKLKAKLLPIMDRIEADPAKYSAQSTFYGVSELIGYLYAGSKQTVERGLKLLRRMADLITQPAYLGMLVAKMRALVTGSGIPKDVITPYLEDLKKWRDSPTSDTGAKEMSKQIIAYYEGKDLEAVVTRVDNVEQKVEDQGQKIEKVEKDVTEVKQEVKEVKQEVKEVAVKATNAENLAKQASADATEAKQEAKQTREEVKEVKQEVKETKQLAETTAKRVDKVETDVQETRTDVTNMKTDVARAVDAAQKMEDALKELAEIREYIDSRISEVKDFIAEVVKKLPLPIAFSDEGIIIKNITLYFECSSKVAPNCLFPGPDKDKRFKTVTKKVHKWLKVAFSAIQLGKAIFEQNPLDGLSAIKDAYDACMEQDDKDFRAFCSEPFLTSEEQDNLIGQLRDEHFFERFSYDAQNGGWQCTRCAIHKKSAKEREVLEKQQAKSPSQGDSVPSSPKPEKKAITKSGTLKHQGHYISKLWKTKVWTLTETTLTYSDPKKKEKSKEALKISEIQNVVHVAKEKFYKEFVFCVTADKRVYYVQAASKQEADEWVEAIKTNLEIVSLSPKK